jgi:transcriptional regulator with XRE-family HTH domain
MTLKDWLAANEMSDAEFARRSGIGQRALVQKYRRGDMRPSIKNVERIRVATNGAVTANDFVAQRVAAMRANDEAANTPTAAESAA